QHIAALDKVIAFCDDQLAQEERTAIGECADNARANKRPKRSTVKDEGRVKLIAALSKHHPDGEGGSLNLEPIGNNRLAAAAGVHKSTASAFFKKQFGGYSKYKAHCRDRDRLLNGLKLLRNEVTPRHLLGDSASNIAAPQEDDTE